MALILPKTTDPNILSLPLLVKSELPLETTFPLHKLCAVCLRSTLYKQLLPLWWLCAVPYVHTLHTALPSLVAVCCALSCRLFAESHRNYVYREEVNKRRW